MYHMCISNKVKPQVEVEEVCIPSTIGVQYNITRTTM